MVGENRTGVELATNREMIDIWDTFYRRGVLGVVHKPRRRIRNHGVIPKWIVWCLRRDDWVGTLAPRPVNHVLDVTLRSERQNWSLGQMCLLWPGIDDLHCSIWKGYSLSLCGEH